MTAFSAALLLFLVMDPFGNIPFFISALKKVDSKKHNKIILRELFIALVVLIAFLFAGRHILSILQISEPSLTVAGGIILFIIALKMIFPTQMGMFSEEITEEPFVFPLAIPYIAGPSAIASVMIIMSREPNRWKEWSMALVAAWLVSGLIILSSGAFLRILGKRVLTAIERLMGMMLVTIAVQMLMNGISKYISTI